jgi:uncharacterized protein involved in exopolysaccharide biosynthesis
MAAPQDSVTVSRRPPDVEDYIDMLRRYRSWVIGPAFAGLVISMVVAFWWPDTYACTAAMQIKPGAATGLLPSVNGKMAQRLQELQLQILARDNLIALIQNPKLDLYKRERQRYPVEDIAEEMGSKHIKIIPISTENENHGAQAFRIWFEYPDKVKALKVVQELISEFHEQNGNLQLEEANSRTTVMETLVKNAREKVDHDQTDLANFTAENQAKLPMGMAGFGNATSDGGYGALAANIDITQKTNAINDLNDQIGREQQNQTLFDGQLANLKRLEVQAESNLTQTTQVTNQTVVKNQNLINVDRDITNKKTEIEALLRRFQPDFPDVLGAKDQLRVLEDHRDQLEKEDVAGPTQPGTTTRQVRNPEAERQLNQIRSDENDAIAKIAISKQAVELKQKRVAEITKELRDIRDKMSNSTPILQKFTALKDSLAMDKDEYEKLSKTKDVSDNSQSVEEARAGETLETLEQPITPETPVFPHRPEIISIGTLLGLTLGVVLAAAKEIKNTSLKNLKDVRAYTNLPVLSSIPLLENALLVRRKRRLAWVAWSSAVILGSILMCGAVYYHLVIAQQVG